MRRNQATAEARGRWFSRKKMEAVLYLLKGEDWDSLCRELGGKVWRNGLSQNWKN
jgi:hypothetical protein